MYYSSRLAKSYRDPHWTTARFNSKCHSCEQTIKTGSSIFYYPNGKKVFCDKQDCGQARSREFDAHCFDDRMMSSQFDRDTDW